MRWQTKNALRCDLARLQAQNEGLTVQLRQRDEYITKLERLLDVERDRVLAERERADRAGDALLQQNGVAAISSLGVAQSKAAQEEADAEMKRFRETVGHIYAESLDDLQPDSEQSDEIKTILQGVKEAIA